MTMFFVLNWWDVKIITNSLSLCAYWVTIRLYTHGRGGGGTHKRIFKHLTTYVIWDHIVVLGAWLLPLAHRWRCFFFFERVYFFGEVCKVKFMTMFWSEGLPFFLGSPLSSWPTSQMWTYFPPFFFNESTLYVKLLTFNRQMMYPK